MRGRPLTVASGEWSGVTKRYAGLWATPIIELPALRGSLVALTETGRADIRYLLLTYNAPGGKEIWAAMSESERAAEEAEYRDLIQSMREERIFLAAEEVEHYDAAQTVRVRNGILSVSDGPAVNADVFLTGTS